NLPKSLESYSQEIGRAGRDSDFSIVEMFACTDDIPTLENFAYGDTPAERAVTGLISHLQAQPQEFDVSFYELSVRTDARRIYWLNISERIAIGHAVTAPGARCVNRKFFPARFQLQHLTRCCALRPSARS